MKSEANKFFAAQAWVQGGWAHDVLLTVADDGRWHSVQPNATAAEQAGAIRLQGPVLPGLVNAHSHAFQRAIAGLTERRGPGTAAAADDFWSWRERMYSAAGRITPDQLEAIASLLYAELLAGGYTQVCEFHYLHNGVDGAPYADPAEMALALARAARRTGIGLTLLPALYMRSGFAASGLRDEQRLFASTPASVLRVAEQIKRLGDSRIDAGVAVHSLRAADPAALSELAAAAKQAGLPLHLHIAEQTQEVADCIAHTGQRPIEWLLNHAEVDARWHLVHATHATPVELAALQASGASVVLCPATEANLGDGVFDLPAYAATGQRVNCLVNLAGMRIGGDYTNGRIYQQTRKVYADDQYPLVAVRRTPHVWDKNDRNRVRHSRLQLDFFPGSGLSNGQGSNPQAMLRWSNYQGQTFGNEHWTSLGAQGQTTNRAIWRRLGSSRDRVYEVRISDPVKRDVAGASLRAEATQA